MKFDDEDYIEESVTWTFNEESFTRLIGIISTSNGEILTPLYLSYTSIEGYWTLEGAFRAYNLVTLSYKIILKYLNMIIENNKKSVDEQTLCLFLNSRMLTEFALEEL